MGGEPSCKLCNSQTEETLEHFLIDCVRYGDEREEYGINNKSVAEILLFIDRSEVEKIKMYLGAIWKKRKTLLRSIS